MDASLLENGRDPGKSNTTTPATEPPGLKYKAILGADSWSGKQQREEGTKTRSTSGVQLFWGQGWVGGKEQKYPKKGDTQREGWRWG